MRTSPPPMRPRAARRAAAALLIALVAASGAACSDDEPTGADDPSPTTTAPADDETTTTEPAETSSETTVAEGSGGPLTVETATAELETLLAQYRDVLVAAQASGTLDERTVRDLTGVFSAEQAQDEVAGLEQAGGAAIIRPDAPVPVVGAVEVVDATETCTSLTADVPGIGDMVTVDVPYDPPYYVRLVAAPDGATGWRIEFLASSNNGQPLEEARCA